MFSRKKFFLLLIIALVILGGWWIAKRFALLEKGFEPGEVRKEAKEVLTETTPKSLESDQNGGTKIRIDTLTTGLDTPWSIVFTEENRLLVTERSGRIRVIEDGKLLEQPLHTFSEVSETGEEGLMSLALHPNYSENRFMYVSLAYEQGNNLFVKVLRFRDEGTRLVDMTIVLDPIPAARYHAGNRLAFGPDGKLYISTGDATEKNLAQDIQSLAGKILRLNDDGSIPNDNPFPGKAIWSYGHRNPQGIAWHPDNDALYSTEHGPSVFDGPAGGDEVNLIEKGKNYGWPWVSHEQKRAGTEAPLITFTPAEAPASLLIYSGRQRPEWRGSLFFGALKGEGLMRLEVSATDPKKIVSSEKLAEVGFGRIREVTEGPDGFIYFTTSNRDGRGKPASEDDRVFRLRFEQ